MHYLLDTHTWLWSIDGNGRISEKSKEIIQDEANKIKVSVVSFWETAIKLSINKIKLNHPLKTLIDNTQKYGVEILSLDPEYILKIENLPSHHRDPFDRIIISTALAEKLPIISNDEKFDLYDVKRIW